MIKIIAAIIWLLVFTKLFFFWVWFWQIKEYHWGRFKAHFETQKIRKLLSCLKYAKFPKLTKKTIIILTSGILFELLILFYIFSWFGNLTASLSEYLFYFSLLIILIILSPVIFSLFILSFQIPTNIIIKIIIKKAKKKRKKLKNLLVIGVTGSYGKTSTKEFLAAVLSEKFNILKTRVHTNAKDGIAAVILKELKPEHQIFIAEIGAYEKGVIKEVCQMLEPRIGILTGINQQHMSTFGSQENIVRAKFELIESLPEEGTAVLNWDNGYIKSKVKSQKSKVKIIKYGIKDKTECDVWAEDVRVGIDLVSFIVKTKAGESQDFKVNLLGGYNVPNLLAAISCAKELGMSIKEIALACQKIKPEQSGLKLIKTKSGLNLIDSSYSANPDGVIADLEYLKLWEKKRIIVMPCLIELGKASAEIHKKIGRKIAEVCDLAIITTKDRFKEIKEGAIEAARLRPSGFGEVKMSKENILLIEKPREIIEKIKNFNGPEDVVLLEGRVPKEVIKELVAAN